MANYITLEIARKIVVKRGVLDYDCHRFECGIGLVQCVETEISYGNIKV